MPFYKANNEYNASLESDYTVGDATLNVNTLPTNVPTIVTVARGTVKETRFTVTGAGAGLLTGVARLDGANENISSGVSVECMIDEDFINQLEAAVFTQTSLKGLVYAADGGASDAYAITLAVAPSAYADITGLPISFKANTVNTGAATLNINSLGAKSIKKQNDQDLADGDIESGQVVTVVYDGTNFQLQSQVANDPEVDSPIITTTSYAPQGFLINGKIVPSVSSNNLTVAIKGMDGNDPSVSNPVYCRIGDTVRTITSALSVTKNAGTNWFNAGQTGMATREVDYFVYLGYNATDGVVIGFARIPHARKYGDFSATTTNDKYAAISTITTAASTDYYQLIGRFAATLSATASFNWSVPTFTAENLIQRPIYETRWLEFQPAWTGFSADPAYGTVTPSYKISGDICHTKAVASANGTSNSAEMNMTLPMVSKTSVPLPNTGRAVDNGAILTSPAQINFTAGSNSGVWSTQAGGGFVTSGAKSVNWSFYYEI